MSRSGPQLVFLHGFLGSRRDFDDLCALLPGSKAIDLPGHGGNTNLADWDSAVDWLGEEAQDAHLVGYSMGGRLALAAALRYPDRIARLTLISSSPGIADAEERSRRYNADCRLADELERGDFREWLERWYAQPLFASLRSQLPTVIAKRLRGSPERLAQALRGFSVGQQPPLWDELENLKCPTRLVVGELDRKYCVLAETLRVKSPRIATVLVSNGGHALVEELSAEELQGCCFSTLCSASCAMGSSC